MDLLFSVFQYFQSLASSATIYEELARKVERTINHISHKNFKQIDLDKLEIDQMVQKVLGEEDLNNWDNFRTVVKD